MSKSDAQKLSTDEDDNQCSLSTESKHAAILFKDIRSLRYKLLHTQQGNLELESELETKMQHVLVVFENVRTHLSETQDSCVNAKLLYTDIILQATLKKLETAEEQCILTPYYSTILKCPQTVKELHRERSLTAEVARRQHYFQKFMEERERRLVDVEDVSDSEIWLADDLEFFVGTNLSKIV